MTRRQGLILGAQLAVLALVGTIAAATSRVADWRPAELLLLLRSQILIGLQELREILAREAAERLEGFRMLGDPATLVAGGLRGALGEREAAEGDAKRDREAADSEHRRDLLGFRQHSSDPRRPGEQSSHDSRVTKVTVGELQASTEE